jgi:hypothetical protein
MLTVAIRMNTLSGDIFKVPSPSKCKEVTAQEERSDVSVVMSSPVALLLDF